MCKILAHSGFKGVPIHILLLAAFLEYQQHAKNREINEKIILAKSDGYPMKRVQLVTTIDKLGIRRWDYVYACTPNGL